MRNPDSFHLAPSQYHQHVMGGLTQECRYQGEEVSTWQQAVRARVAACLGLIPRAEAPPPVHVYTLWQRDHTLGTIEKLIFTSEQYVDVPAYLCLPSQGAPPYPCVICLQGHTTGMHLSIGVDRHDETTPIVVEDDTDFALQAMRQGYAALCIEQRSFGERQETVQPQHLDYLCHQAAMNALLLGRTLLGERIDDIDRAIDLLAQRGDIDLARLGILGHSGGGTASLFAAAMLPRIRFAVPAGYFSSFRASIQSMFHCVCNYVPGLYRIAEMGDIAGLIAPRPLLLVSGDADGIFPLDAARGEFHHVQQIYAAAGAPEACRHLVCSGGHRFFAEATWSALRTMRC